MAQVRLLASLDDAGTLSNSVPPCYKIAAFRPDRSRFAFRDTETVDLFVGCLSRLLGDAPVVTLPCTFMGQPVYVRRGYPAPCLVVGDYLRSFSCVNPVADTPNVWLEVMSLPFWLLDGSADEILMTVAAHVSQLVWSVMGQAVPLLLTGLHLCLDVVADYAAVYGGLTNAEIEEYYVSRMITPASQLGQRMTSHWFGKSSRVRWNIYDKCQEIADKGGDHYSDVWRAAGWSDGEPVTRVECQLGREYFSTHAPLLRGDLAAVPADWLGSRVSVDAWYGFAGAIWADVTTRTRYTLADDSNRSRCTLHPFWQVVQAAALLDGDQVGQVARVDTATMQAVERNVKAMAGYAKRIAAQTRRPGYIPTLADVCEQLQSDVAVDLRARGQVWSGDVMERVQLRAIPLSFAVV